jgi:chromosome segregation ATPase
MEPTSEILTVLKRLETRISEIDDKIERVSWGRSKSMEWIGTLSEQIRSLDDFREEVRASFEPLFGKLDGLDELVRVLRHAQSDVSRRIEEIEQTKVA